jgi:hypothetical protein
VLRRDAAERQQIKAAAEQQRISDVVSDAIKAGNIGPARSKHWVSLIQADPGMADVLASVPDNTVPGGHHFGGHAPAAPVAACLGIVDRGVPRCPPARPVCHAR